MTATRALAPRPRPLPGLALALALLPSPALGDTITGKVVDHLGAAVAGVNIDAFDSSTGDEVTLSNDSTDVNGNFSATIDQGVYTVVFFPPPPPTTTHAATQVESVVVVGTKNMGTIALPEGVALSGTVLQPGGSPMVGLDLDLVDRDTNEEVPLTGDQTDANGDFLIASPRGDVELQLEPDYSGTGLAPENRVLDLSADTDVGTIQLELGFLLEARVKKPGGAPVVGADLDAVDTATGEKRYTPGDNTDSVGDVDVIVPAGTYDVELCAKISDRLVTKIVAGVVVSSDTDLGDVFMQNGVLLSGTVFDAQLNPIPKVDLDVSVSSTGAEVPVCGDNTNASGDYAVVVPTGTYDIEYEPVPTDPFCTLDDSNVVVSGDTTWDVTLVDCDAPTPVGIGTPGAGGFVPRLKASGCLRLGNGDFKVKLKNGLGGAQAFVFVGLGGSTSRGSGPGGVLGIGSSRLLVPTVHLVLSGPNGVPGVGKATAALPLPKEPVLSGMTLRIEAVVDDPGPSFGNARPRPLTGTLCE